jgi:hypothetical protein
MPCVHHDPGQGLCLWGQRHQGSWDTEMTRLVICGFGWKVVLTRVLRPDCTKLWSKLVQIEGAQSSSFLPCDLTHKVFLPVFLPLSHTAVNHWPSGVDGPRRPHSQVWDLSTSQHMVFSLGFFPAQWSQGPGVRRDTAQPPENLLRDHSTPPTTFCWSKQATSC